MKELLLAFEGGGTKTRIILADADGAILQTETAGSSSALYIHPKEYARSIRSLLKRLRKRADAVGGAVVRAGLAAPMDQNLVESLIRERFGDVQFAWLSEADIALALHDLDWGISLVAGTGSSCRYLSRDGVWVTSGGLGPQFGDEGSGYWIGKEAIAAAMRAETAQGPATDLHGRLRVFYELDRMLSVLKLCDRSGHVPAPRVAACVPVVIACAVEGDTEARLVLRRAGRALGDLVLTTARKARVKKGPVPLVLTGGIFHAGKLVLNTLRRTLKTGPHVFTIYPAAAEPAQGILRILTRQCPKEK
jgi:N-acetylglucosamine kinase-like BadF-type ATPase